MRKLARIALGAASVSFAASFTGGLRAQEPYDPTMPDPVPAPGPVPAPVPAPVPVPAPQPYPYPYPQPGQYPYPQPYPQPGQYPYPQPGQYPYPQPYPYPGQPYPPYPRPGQFPYPQPPIQPPNTPPPNTGPSGEARANDHLTPYVTFSLGFTGGLGVAVLDQPDDQTLAGTPVKPLYPGFTGLDGAFGAVIEMRILGYFGIEMDLLYAHEAGSADISATKSDGTFSQFNIEIGHSAFHLPLLFKGVIPGEVASPFIFLGPEFVVPNADADVEITGTNITPTNHTAHTEDYTMFAFGLGFEINLPTKGVDLRIPITVRGGFNPGVSDRREERGTHTLGPDGVTYSEFSYTTAWQWTARLQLGLTVNF